jgi:sigma-B regulation protein RsbQ
VSVLTRNNVHVLGEEEQAMRFARGYGCDQRMRRFITPGFEHDYRLVRFDHVGSGLAG